MAAPEAAISPRDWRLSIKLLIKSNMNPAYIAKTSGLISELIAMVFVNHVIETTNLRVYFSLVVLIAWILALYPLGSQGLLNLKRC